jgi:hypothetical protein
MSFITLGKFQIKPDSMSHANIKTEAKETK